MGGEVTRSHSNNSRCPPLAAHNGVNEFQGQLCSRAHCSTSEQRTGPLIPRAAERPLFCKSGRSDFHMNYAQIRWGAAAASRLSQILRSGATHHFTHAVRLPPRPHQRTSTMAFQTKSATQVNALRNLQGRSKHLDMLLLDRLKVRKLSKQRRFL